MCPNLIPKSDSAKPSAESVSRVQLSCIKLLTSPSLHHLVHFLTRIHGAEIEHLYNRSSVLQLRSVIRGRCKLFENLAANPRRRLLHLDDRTIAKVALDEKNYFIIVNKDLIPKHVVEPPLHRRLDADLILVSPCPGGRQRRRDCRHESFWVR